MIKRLVLTLVFLNYLVLSAYAAFQLGSTIGTPAGTGIAGNTVTANYNSGERIVQRTATASISDIIVDPIYGYDIEMLTNAVKGIEPGQTITYNFTVKNVGNTVSENFRLVTENVLCAGDFAVEAPAQQQKLDMGTTASYVITVNSLSTATTDASITMNANFEVMGYTDQPTSYTGYNGNVYGGYVDLSPTLNTWIEYPILLVSKNFTIGHSWDSGTTPVPGATVTINLVYRNTGSGTANNVVFTDIVPTTNTDYKMLSTRNICTDPGVTATFKFSTIADPTTYTYTPVGVKVDPNVARIRIEMSPIKRDVQGTLNYTVVIE